MIRLESLQFFTKEAKKLKKESKDKKRVREQGMRRYGLVSLGGTLGTLPFTAPLLQKDLASQRGYTKEEALNLVPDLARQYDGDYRHVTDLNEYSVDKTKGKPKRTGPHFMDVPSRKIKNISVGRNVDEAVLAHELGHATGLKAPTRALRTVGSLASRGASLSNAYNLGRIGLDHYNIVDDEVERDKRLSNLQAGFGIQGIGSLGTLAEEARATKRAIQSGLKRGKGLEYAAKLSPAYATYMVPTALAGTGYYGIKKYRETE